MILFQRIRGPRLGTKIMLLGLTLLIVPWFSYRQLVEMERLLIQGQSNAQLLTAEGISTLFNGREDLFNDLPVTVEDFESLYAHPLQNALRLDGRAEDWGEVQNRVLRFGSESGTAEGDFRLLLGERGGNLYVYMDVLDSARVYRSAEHLRLDNADHIRLRYIRNDGDDGRVTLAFSEPGVITAYEMDADWRYARSGTPNNAIQGFVDEVEGGFRLEFRMPLSMLGSSRYFGIAFVDVDDPLSREVRGITQTLPTAGKESFNLVVLRSPEVLNIIQGLGYSGARILVIDNQKRVRAETGTNIALPDPEKKLRAVQILQEWFGWMRPWIHRLMTGSPWEPGRALAQHSASTAEAVINSVLAGDPIALRRSIAEDEEVIMAAHPIIAQNEVIGSVVVEQNINDILSFQRDALEQVILVSIVSLFAVFIALLAFAARLAWRIRKLRREASNAIDQYGRLRIGELQREMSAGDEIGDLARSVSNMLTKLHQHNNFLESMPRTLRHEINNPLNTLSTSLQNLAEEHEEVRDSKYLESAKRGVLRIGAIVQNLADAANLDESLEAEEREVIDIDKLLQNYVANCHITHRNCEFIYRGPQRPVYADVSDYRIEQLLDKLIDNAIDFHRSNSPIKVQLDMFRDHLQITVANRGPILPDKAGKSLFDSMVSHRGPQNRLHFGLGLYVVRVIAEHHGGFVRAVNLADGSGVAFMVELPLANLSAQITNGTGTQPAAGRITAD